MSLVDSTAFRFTNAACLLFVDSIRELVKFSPTPCHNFYSITLLLHTIHFSQLSRSTNTFFRTKTTNCFFKKLQKKLVWTRMNSSLSLTSTWLISFFFYCCLFRASYTTVNFSIILQYLHFFFSFCRNIFGFWRMPLDTVCIFKTKIEYLQENFYNMYKKIYNANTF